MNFRVKSVALNEQIEIGRIIGEYKSNKKNSPTLIFIGGIHGNEPSGVFALHSVCKKLKPLANKIKANIYAIAGNLGALEKGVRYQKNDLNRLWIEEGEFNFKHIGASEMDFEHLEHEELHQLISKILRENSGPFYFFDLHTTSSKSVAFATINDTLINRKLAVKFPIPIILGIEEYIEGPLLSYINHLGHVAIGFEAGQHDDLNSILNHEAFVWLSFNYLNVLDASEIPDYKYHHNLLTNNAPFRKQVFDILYLYKIQAFELFEMVPGFENFHRIKKGEKLGMNQNGEIVASSKGRILMPKYQSLGNDGYFITRRIPKVWLYTSTLMRRLKLENAVALLPGVKKVEGESHTLQVNLKIARFLASDLFHLLGYRRKTKSENSIIFKKREYDFKSVTDLS